MKHIPDLLWREIEKIIPQKETLVGRPEFDARKTLDGILFILITGAQWKMLPEKYGCPTTVHGKFMKWCRMGVFQKIMTRAREYYRRRNSKNNWYAFDTASRKAPFAKCGGKNPTDRAKRGIKQAIVVDRKGAPLFTKIAPANKHDSRIIEPTMKPMRKSKNLRILAADGAFDVKRIYENCKQKNIVLLASPNPRRKRDVHKHTPPYRWIVERTIGILSWIRGIKTCWAKTYESAQAFLDFACSLRLFKMAGIFG